MPNEPTSAQLAARFKPGQPSANPGGRPKGVERRIRELLKDDWDAIARAMADIALGRLPPGISGETTVKIKDRIDAARFLFDRGWGKARTVVDVQADIIDGAIGSVEVDELDEASLVQLEDMLKGIREGRPRTVIDAKVVEVRPALAPTVDPKST